MGLLKEYWKTLCGVRKVGCEGEELILFREEWNEGFEREKNGIEWARLDADRRAEKLEEWTEYEAFAKYGIGEAEGV
jgi:hypothetical protein